MDAWVVVDGESYKADLFWRQDKAEKFLLLLKRNYSGFDDTPWLSIMKVNWKESV
jgi:hypothetical protein